jgi:hypothetical protein
MLICRRDTRSGVVLQLRPVAIWGYWGFGAAFIGAGTIVLLVFGRETRLTCQPRRPAEAWCVVEIGGFLSTARAEGPLRSARSEDSVRWGLIALRHVVVTLGGQDVRLNLVAADGVKRTGWRRASPPRRESTSRQGRNLRKTRGQLQHSLHCASWPLAPSACWRSSASTLSLTGTSSA